MKHLVTLVALVTLLALSQGCRRHASTVAPYGWPSITPTFDSLTVEAEKLYFITSDPDSLHTIVDSMKVIASGLKGEKGIDARACVDYWLTYWNMIVGRSGEVRKIVDSVLNGHRNTPPRKYM